MVHHVEAHSHELGFKGMGFGDFNKKFQWQHHHDGAYACARNNHAGLTFLLAKERSQVRLSLPSSEQATASFTRAGMLIQDCALQPHHRAIAKQCQQR